MARVQSVIGFRSLPVLFHGHEPNGDPARSGQHSHLFFCAYSSTEDSRIDRVAVIAPDFCDRNSQTTKWWGALERAVDELQFLVCGSKGKLQLEPITPEGEKVLGLSRRWRSVTHYNPTRHPKGTRPHGDFIACDVKAECARRSLPIPHTVEVLEIQNGPRGSLSAHLALSFKSAVRGPLLLGRRSHFGDGLFAEA